MCVSLEVKEFHRISRISFAVTGSRLVKGHPSVHLDGDTELFSSHPGDTIAPAEEKDF